MINFVALPAILQKVMLAGSVKIFGEIKDLIMSMLDTYNYEKTLLQTTNRILANDLYWVCSFLFCLLFFWALVSSFFIQAMRSRRDSYRKGFAVSRRSQCGICRRPVLGMNPSFALLFYLLYRILVGHGDGTPMSFVCTREDIR